MATEGGKPNPIASKEAADEHAQIKRWRLKAEEQRTAADPFAVPLAQESLRRAAANYEHLANNAEEMLEGRPSAPGERAR